MGSVWGIYEEAFIEFVQRWPEMIFYWSKSKFSYSTQINFKNVWCSRDNNGANFEVSDFSQLIGTNK